MAACQGGWLGEALLLFCQSNESLEDSTPKAWVEPCQRLLEMEKKASSRGETTPPLSTGRSFYKLWRARSSESDESLPAKKMTRRRRRKRKKVRDDDLLIEDIRRFFDDRATVAGTRPSEEKPSLRLDIANPPRGSFHSNPPSASSAAPSPRFNVPKKPKRKFMNLFFRRKPTVSERDSRHQPEFGFKNFHLFEEPWPGSSKDHCHGICAITKHAAHQSPNHDIDYDDSSDDDDPTINIRSRRRSSASSFFK